MLTEPDPFPPIFEGGVRLRQSTVRVCVLINISPLERLFVLKTLSYTQRETKVKTVVGFSLKPLCCRDPATPPLYGHMYRRPFCLRKARMHVIAVRACAFCEQSTYTCANTHYSGACICSVDKRCLYVFTVLRQGFAL